MAASNSWCQEKLSKLLNEEARIPTLREMKDFLTEMPREDVVRATNSLQLPIIFDCLNDSNSEQVDLACEVLSLCMLNLNLGESTSKYGILIERALNHPYSAVKLMALTEIKRNIDSDDVLVELCKRESLIDSVIKCIADSDIEVAKKASSIITILGLSDVGIKLIISPQFIKSFQEIMTINDIVKIRVYETLVKICAQSENNFCLINSSQLLSQVLVELDNNDILLRLNVLEILSELGQCKHGYEYLVSTDVLKKILGMLESDDLISVQLCQPGILKFFGNIAYWNPSEILSKFPKFVERLFNNTESDDFTVINVTLDTLGHIGLSNRGKIALDSTGIAIQNAIKNIVKALPSYPTEIKVHGLNCLENLLRMEEYDTQICNITQNWYKLIDDNPMEFIWKYARNPFADIRLGGMGILNALASQPWGQDEIKNTAGLVEFLLDRNLEVVKECKEAKYEIVKLLSSSPVFDHLTLKKLKTYVNEGPFYVHTVMEVAVEGNE